MPDFAVRNYGTDSSGRPIYATAYMWQWWQEVRAEIGFPVTIVQGAFMVRAGGGADASAGYHDAGGCFDLRTWDLTGSQVNTVIRVLRENGAAAWRRDRQHGGMDPHIHFVLGSDKPLARGAASQWSDYIAGRDGLASRGADYEARPNPLVLTPPEDDMTPAQAAQLDGLTKAVAGLAEMVEALADGNEAIKRRITKSKREVLDAVKQQP